MRKKWRSNRSLRRGSPSRDLRPAVLVVCEGAKTEPEYFKDLRQALRVNVAVEGAECGSHPKSVVQYAKSQKNAYDCIWCVFDHDDHTGLSAALEQARNNGFKVAFSNPCFELWYLLHFQEQRAYVERNVLFTRLKEHVPGYVKSQAGLYSLLSDRQSQAIQRAQNLRANHRTGGSPENENPSTTMDCLVSFLNALASN